MCSLEYKSFSKNLLFNPIIMLLFFLIGLTACPAVSAETGELAGPGDSALEIAGDGVANSLVFTLAELEAMPQYEQIYSTINTWPTKRWYMARGIKLRELLALAGIKSEATLIKFMASDNYEMILTVKELWEDERYYFPGLKENHPYDGSIPGSADGKQEVEPILALVSSEDSTDPLDMDDRNGLMLILGQRAVTEQTWLLYVKHLRKIEVMTAAPEKWDAPRVNVPDGAVLPPGTGLTLQNKYTDADKIHYTTDGSEPTVDSPMFNWSAKRWWEQRDDVDSINIPLEIVKEMISDNYGGESIVVLKLRTIGPGKEDSEIATYTFRIDPDAEDPTEIAGGPATGVILDRSALDLPIGHTFQLDATVEPFNVLDRNVIWRSSDTSVATVDTRGLVTIVGPGSAVITAEAVDGGFKAVCVINGPEGKGYGAETMADEGDIPQEEVEPFRNVDTPFEADLSPIENEAVFSAELPSEPDMMEATNGSIIEGVGQQPPLTERNWQYLAGLEDLADNLAHHSPAAEHFQGVFSQAQIFELSTDTAIPLPLREQQKELGPYVATIFLFLFFSGAGRKYAEYVKEH